MDVFLTESQLWHESYLYEVTPFSDAPTVTYPGAPHLGTMRRFLYFVLQLYVAVILTLLLSDYIVTNRRLAQFQKLQDCCSTATEQYRSFVAVAQQAARLSAYSTPSHFTRVEKYRALLNWESALQSSIKDSASPIWNQPGKDAAQRLTRFLGNRHITPAVVSTLVAKYREAGDGYDPTLSDEEEKASTFLLKNLNYLTAVADVAGGQLRELLVKQVGSAQELEIYVVAQEAVQSHSAATPGCGALRHIEDAATLGRRAGFASTSDGFLLCVRSAVRSKVRQLTGPT